MSKVSAPASKPELPILAFATPAAFRRWLQANHAAHPGLWLQIAKKDSGLTSVTYAEALDEALCHGWIDGQKQAHDAKTFLQKFTRRGPRSTWSQINVGHIARLSQAGRMHPAGEAAVAAAQADGRWAQAYASSRTAEMPADLLALLAKHTRARAFFATLNAANRYAIFFRLATAKKPETRARRLAQIFTMLKRGEKFH